MQNTLRRYFSRKTFINHARALHSTSCSRSFSTSEGKGPETHFGFKNVPVEEKEYLVKEVFDSVAEKYDIMNDLMSGGLHRLWKDDFVRRLRLSACIFNNYPYSKEKTSIKGDVEPLDILDVAGGTGDIAFRMMDEAIMCCRSNEMHNRLPENNMAYPLPNIVVSDINSEMLKVGQKRAKAKFYSDATILEHMNFVEANAETLPFADNSFDIYTIAFGLRNVTQRGMALNEAYRVLKPGGRLSILEFSSIPNAPLQQIYDLYSFNVIPKMGQLVTGNEDAYKYLVESIRKFPNQEELKRELFEHNFKEVDYINYTFGTVACHSGFKL